LHLHHFLEPKSHILFGGIIMKRIWILMILIECPIVTLGQGNESGSSTFGQGSKPGSSGSPPYQPAVPPPSTTVYGGGDWGYGGDVQSAPGAALQGMSQVISSAGQYNLATSAAAVNMIQAESKEMKNLIQGVQAFWEMRNFGHMQRATERGPRPVQEELARRARAGALRALSTSEMDPVSGVLFWPVALQDDSFNAQRIALDEYAVRWAKLGGLNYTDQAQVRENINAMFDVLKSQITSVPPQEYAESRTFLQSLLFTITRNVL
jgi:hypothetical protein